MIDRRMFCSGCLIAAGAAFTGGSGWAASELEVNDDGLHTQPWFLETFLDLREDHKEAAGENKRLVVIWEQRGCPYCREMHAVNFQKKQIVEFVSQKFAVLQLNLWGSRTVTDFDGTEHEERALARKWAVNFTPTIQFFDTNIPAGKTGRDMEVARIPGYFKPFHFLSMFEFVDQKAYESVGFQRFLQDKFADHAAKGIKPDVW